ncbi:unnamed protein product, partial [Ixodes persulcatus]
MEILWCRLFVFVIVAAVQAREDLGSPNPQCEEHPPNVATCTDPTPVFYFDLLQKVCKQVHGCNFSRNAFNNSGACESACPLDKYCLLQKPQQPVDACVDPEKKTEPNLDNQKNTSLWYFDERQKKCVATDELSKNTFPSHRHCQASCAKYSVCYVRESRRKRKSCDAGEKLLWYFDTRRSDCF